MPAAMATSSTHLNVRRLGNVIVMELLDRRLIDQAAIMQLGDAMQEAISGSSQPKIIVDFERVQFLSSASLGALISLANTAQTRGGEVRLCNLQPDLRKVMSLARLQKVMKFCKDREDALKGWS